ncbi:MAG: hypothetical protein ACLTXL_10490 [Clostridia bacterium]
MILWKEQFHHPGEVHHRDDAMAKGDRTVTIYISPDGGMSISVFPWPDEESLRVAYERGKSLQRLSRTGFSSRLNLNAFDSLV